MQNFQDLVVWHKAHELALAIYRTTSDFPPDELYNLTSQLRRAALSIPSNIAEGCGRDGRTELRRFLRIATGSASEVEYQLLLARDLSYLDEFQWNILSARVAEVRRMLTALIRKLTTDN
ncbi:MAG: four helix bundle protein [Gammaproteobacteria bacterium]|nr:MAG: four helix bundle protein [Gammaproteobacteria bacterium]